MSRRISKTEYYLGIAEAVSKRSTCIRRQYGAVIVKNDEIISTGYNGAPRGQVNCCDEGHCWREENHIPHGQKYELCLSVHAEQNAIISAPRDKMIGAELYLVGFESGKRMDPDDVKPCFICDKMIINAGIRMVITKDKFANNNDTSYKLIKPINKGRIVLSPINKILLQELKNMKGV